VLLTIFQPPSENMERSLGAHVGRLVHLLRDSFRLARAAVKRRYVDTVARVVANRLTAQMDFYQDWAAAQTWR